MVRISVIIPTRNRPADLGRCLAALTECEQDLARGTTGARLHDVIIVDDASSVAGSTAAAEHTELPVSLLVNQRQSGAGASRRRAVQAAEGDLLAFLDDDAMPRGDWLTVVATIAHSRLAITGRVLPFDAGLVSQARQARYDARYAPLSAGAPVGFFAGGNSAISAKLFHDVGGFAREGTGGDNSLAESLALAGDPVRFEPDLVVAHRNGKGIVRAAIESWNAGIGHPQRMGLLQAVRSTKDSGVGGTWPVRGVNRLLGVVHAAGRTASRTPPRRRENR